MTNPTNAKPNDNAPADDTTIAGEPAETTEAMLTGRTADDPRAMGEEIDWSDEDDYAADVAAAIVSRNPAWLPALKPADQERVQRIWAEQAKSGGSTSSKGKGK